MTTEQIMVKKLEASARDADAMRFIAQVPVAFGNHTGEIQLPKKPEAQVYFTARASGFAKELLVGHVTLEYGPEKQNGYPTYTGQTHVEAGVRYRIPPEIKKIVLVGLEK